MNHSDEVFYDVRTSSAEVVRLEAIEKRKGLLKGEIEDLVNEIGDVKRQRKQIDAEMTQLGVEMKHIELEIISVENE